MSEKTVTYLALVIFTVIGLCILSDQTKLEHKISELEKTLTLEGLGTHKHPFEFHYVKEEHYTNEYIVYRFNLKTGDIERFSYLDIDEDKANGAPPHSWTKRVNLITGKEEENIDLDEQLSYKFWQEDQMRKINPPKPKPKQETNPYDQFIKPATPVSP